MLITIALPYPALMQEALEVLFIGAILKRQTPTKIKLIVNCAYLFYFITPYTSPLSLVVRHGYGQTYPIQTNLFYPNCVAMPYYFLLRILHLY